MRSFLNIATPHRALPVLVLVFLWVTGCIHQDEVSPEQPFISSGRSLEADNPNAKSASYPGDYKITVTVNGKIWTYCITKCEGAKDLSNFSINLQNCGLNSATIKNIVWATVNGKPATLESSNGRNGCDIQSVTTNFVKFDNLPSAPSYKIVFEVDKLLGNFVTSTAWLKAGTSCHPYAIVAPCCPL